MRAPMKLLIAEGQGLGLVGHQHQNTCSRNHFCLIRVYPLFLLVRW